MEKNLSKLTYWILEKAEVNADNEYASVCVDFPNIILESFNRMEIVRFVADLHPEHSWTVIGCGLGENCFQVYLHWYEDDEIRCANEGEIPTFENEDMALSPDDIELHLDPEKQRRLTELIKKSIVDESIYLTHGYQ